MLFRNACLLFFCMILLGCQSLHSRSYLSYHKVKPHRALQKKDEDSAPLGPIPRFFKLIRPKDEPLSRYGNPATYQVNGRTYTVMKSANGYKERGMASWYATKFHSRRTSSGEDYDMYALTAAHKTLPLPTYLRVKNLDNGRVITVKVNDRGPFHSGRILDLSYGSAVKLGVFPKGTAHVEIEAVTVKTINPIHTNCYYLQVAAFSKKAPADSLRRKVVKISSHPVMIQRDKHRYLLQVGPILNKTSVVQLQRTLSKNGIKGSFSLLGSCSK